MAPGNPVRLPSLPKTVTFVTPAFSPSLVVVPFLAGSPVAWLHNLELSVWPGMTLNLASPYFYLLSVEMTSMSLGA